MFRLFYAHGHSRCPSVEWGWLDYSWNLSKTCVSSTWSRGWAVLPFFHNATTWEQILFSMSWLSLEVGSQVMLVIVMMSHSCCSAGTNKDKNSASDTEFISMNTTVHIYFWDHLQWSLTLRLSSPKTWSIHSVQLFKCRNPCFYDKCDKSGQNNHSVAFPLLWSQSYSNGSVQHLHLQYQVCMLPEPSPWQLQTPHPLRAMRYGWKLCTFNGACFLKLLTPKSRMNFYPWEILFDCIYQINYLISWWFKLTWYQFKESQTHSLCRMRQVYFLNNVI